MIADFVIEKMNRYIAGGTSPRTAAQFTRGELAAIYKGNHRSRAEAGQWRVTQPPEALDLEKAMVKCDEAIRVIWDTCIDAAMKGPQPGANKVPENSRPVYRSSEAIKRAVAAGIKIKPFFAKGGDNDPAFYTADLQQIRAMWNEGQRRFKAYVRGKFLVIDIDRKPGKPDGLEAFYRLFPRETLPEELQNLPESFPCYTKTPLCGFHLFFKYEGTELKLRELAPSVEIKETQITCPGSRREDGEYVLHGEPDKAPPLYGLIIDAIEEAKRKKEQAKAERSRPRTRVSADWSVKYTQPRITLDALAGETIAAHAGNHDRQVSFAGRAFRCKFSGAETLAYVKSRADIFGNDTDTENTVMSVFRDNGAA